MNSSTPETASMLSLTDDLEELDWYFEDMFDQFGNVYCLFNDINRLLVDCPLEFLLFETQQLVSFLCCHWKCPLSKHTNNDHLPHFPLNTPPIPSLPLLEKIVKYPTSVTSYGDNPLPSPVFVTI